MVLPSAPSTGWISLPAGSLPPELEPPPPPEGLVVAAAGREGEPEAEHGQQGQIWG